jgi:hypothetical protein
MKINEFFGNAENDQFLPDVDFDLPDDLLQYMRNDPVFYRKSFFPAVENCKSSKSIDTGIIEKMIKKGLDKYCKKYNILHNKNELMSAEDVKTLAQRIIKDDVKEQGEYQHETNTTI